MYREDDIANRWKILYMQQVLDDKHGNDTIMTSDSYKVKMMQQLHDIIGSLYRQQLCNLNLQVYLINIKSFTRLNMSY